jgi:hypothetical protein
LFSRLVKVTVVLALTATKFSERGDQPISNRFRPVVSNCSTVGETPVRLT